MNQQSELPGERALRAVLAAMTSGDVEELVRWHSADVVVRYPYAPPTFPSVISGRGELYEFEASVAAKVRTCEFHDVRLRGLTNPVGLLAQYRGRVVLASGRPYDNDYCAVMDLDEHGLLHRVTKYYNPSVIAASGLDSELR